MQRQAQCLCHGIWYDTVWYIGIRICCYSLFVVIVVIIFLLLDELVRSDLGLDVLF
jgi:hypothetical protein